MYPLYFFVILVAFIFPFFAKGWLVACAAVALLVAVIKGRRGKQGEWAYVWQEFTKSALMALFAGTVVFVTYLLWINFGPYATSGGC